MSDPGPAQLELIRRYARTLREMHADAMQARVSPADRAGRIRRAADPIAPTVPASPVVPPPDLTGPAETPTLPAP